MGVPPVEIVNYASEGGHAHHAADLGGSQEWIASQGLQRATDLWECDLAGPESGSAPREWRTELNRPLLS